jgi:hypothetical protein
MLSKLLKTREINKKSIKSAFLSKNTGGKYTVCQVRQKNARWKKVDNLLQ